MSKMKNTFLLLFGFMWLNGTEPVRSWTNIKGNKMEASLVRFKKDKIEIKRNDGRVFTLLPNMFSEEDLKYLTEARTRADSLHSHSYYLERWNDIISSVNPNGVISIGFHYNKLPIQSSSLTTEFLRNCRL